LRAAGANAHQPVVGVMALKLARNKVLVRSFDGFGAQYNQNVFAARSHTVGVTAQNVTLMEQKIGRLAPQIVRVFFNADAFDDADLMQSFRRTVQLAQRTAGAINITLQGLGPNVLRAHPEAIPLFARELAELRTQHGISKLKWATLRNEPNNPSAPMKKRLYASCFSQLDDELKRAGVRGQIGLMGGDLILPKQKEWFRFLANNQALRRVLDAYSIHVYWNYRNPQKIGDRLSGVRKIRENLPEAVRKKPFYVMECGARGLKKSHGVKEDPGFWKDGSRIAGTNVNAFQRVWFALEAAKQGFAGVVAWDAYFGKYDRDGMMHYALLAGPRESEPWPLRPAFRALRVLMRAVEPGSKVVAVDGGSPSQRVVAFTHNQQLTIAGLDTAGRMLNAASPRRSTYEITGLPKNKTFQLCFWNKNGDGQNSFNDQARSNGSGKVTINAPLHSIFVLTTRHIS
jgi:hypothetical protein